jgi:hypothetical protein
VKVFELIEVGPDELEQPGSGAGPYLAFHPRDRLLVCGDEFGSILRPASSRLARGNYG